MPILVHSYFGTMHDLYSIQVIYFVQHLSEIQLIRFPVNFCERIRLWRHISFWLGKRNYLLHCIGVNFWSLIRCFHRSHAKVRKKIKTCELVKIAMRTFACDFRIANEVEMGLEYEPFHLLLRRLESHRRSFRGKPQLRTFLEHFPYSQYRLV